MGNNNWRVFQLVGKLVASEPAVQYANLYVKPLKQKKDKALKINIGNYDAIMYLDCEIHKHLIWWINNIEKSSKPIITIEPSMILQSESLKTGWYNWKSTPENGRRQGNIDIDSTNVYDNNHGLQKVLHLIAGQSYILPKKNLLIHPSDPSRQHPLKKMQLAVFPLSGQDLTVLAYQRTLQTFYMTHGEIPQKSNMGVISKMGAILC
ncbi:unnamed protein product [Mytilus edulis]|uniref:Uncharacterized protein n=1 Tax=Mytilus edulis TaxID=6550 RepID=A0A8S3UWV5_MYTED|nr:unnamed protein product [Mytilus edulis]